MPSLTNQQSDLQERGPIVEVKFMVSQALEKKLKKEGKEIPQPIAAKAMIDTGASLCAIQEDIPQKLGLKPSGEIYLHTASCKNHKCYKYFLRMVIPAHRLEYEGTFTALPLEGQDMDCLIGRDMLANGILIYIGYAKQFTFSLL